MPTIAPTTQEETAASEAWQAAVDKIRSFANLEQGWDSEDGHAPAEIDIENAVHVLNSCNCLTNAVPNIYPVGDGEIILSWKFANKCYLEISLHERYLIYISRTPDGVKIRGAYIYNDKIDPILEKTISEYLSCGDRSNPAPERYLDLSEFPRVPQPDPKDKPPYTGKRGL